MRTREELLGVLVDILAQGQNGHTDCVNMLGDFLDDEEAASCGLLGKPSHGQEEWVVKYRAMPVPR